MVLHELKFKEKNKLVDHGKVESDGEGGLAAKLTILRMTKFSVDYPHFVKASATCVVLRAPAEHDEAKRNQKLRGYLLGNGDRCAVCLVGETGDIGLLTTKPDTGGYLCYLLPTLASSSMATVKTEETGNNGNKEEATVSQVATTSAPEPEKVTGVKRGFEQLAAMKHYNENLQRDRSTRHQSYILHLRNLNNCVKSHLIQYGVKCSKQTAVAILDLGCGMGGDILKWLKGNFEVSRYVGVDIAKASLEQFAGERLKANPHKEKVTHLICADLGTESLTSEDNTLEVHTWERKDGNLQGKWDAVASPLSTGDEFNVASCQFAMHYMFQNPNKASHFFAEISRHLATGGIFVATTIDSRVVVDMAAQVEACSVKNNEDRQGKARKIDHKRKLMFNDNFGNTLLEMSFESDAWNRMVLPAEEHRSLTERMDRGEDDWAYGIQYVFQLRDTGDAAAVNAPEWLVPLGAPLEKLAKKHGLRVALCKNFHEVVTGDFERGANATHIPSNLGKFGVFNLKRTMSETEWRLAHLYVALVFEKM